MIHTLRLFFFSIWNTGENFLVSANIADKLPFLKAVLVVGVRSDTNWLYLCRICFLLLCFGFVIRSKIAWLLLSYLRATTRGKNLFEPLNRFGLMSIDFSAFVSAFIAVYWIYFMLSQGRMGDGGRKILSVLDPRAYQKAIRHRE